MVRIKVCCIASPEEARLAVSLGASALGLVGPMPSGPGVIPDERICEIARRVPPPIATFLLTSETDEDALVSHVRRCGTNTVQLVDAVPVTAYARLRRELRTVRIVQVLHVTGEAVVDQARELGPHVDALLLDSGNPKLAVKELGGTGRVHDWALSRRVVEEAPCPVFLAGGLRPDNVADAINRVRPFGVDVCSGVRSTGQLDVAKLSAFTRAVASADVVALP